MANASPYPPCSDTSDIKPFFKKKGLFLKPLVRINVSIQLPKNKSNEYSISNHALMEAVKELAQPDVFSSIRTTKTAVDLVRLEAEVEVPKNIKWIIPRIEGQTIKLPGHSEGFKVRASMAKNDFPSRHDWDSFFRDTKHMNELKAGERPDTIHIQDLPIEWFTTKASNGKPNEKLVCRIFEQFGAISALDIPSNDPYRAQMKVHISGMKQFNFRTTSLFEVYIQYKDYLSFVCAMDALRGMKLLKKEDEDAWTQVIKVDFDKTKHLSESSIRKRKLLREKIMEKERQNEERCEEVVDNVVQSKIVSGTPGEKEEPRFDDLRPDEDTGVDVSLRKILREEKLFLIAQRKLESIRLLGELLERVADKKSVSGNSRIEKRGKQKSVVSMIKQSTSRMYADRAEEDLLNSSFDTANSFDGPLYNRAENLNWRSRGKGFMNNRRGRGRPMRRGGDFFNSHRNNARDDCNDYSSQSGEGSHYNPRGGDDFNSRGGDSMNYRGADGFNSHGADAFNNWRIGRGQRYNNNRRGRGRTMRDNIPMPGFNWREQELNEYNYQMHAMYYRYFQNLTREAKSRSRSRSRHRSSSKGRGRSRSHHRSSSRGRDRSRSHHRSSSRGRDRSRHRSSSRSQGRSRSRHRSSSRDRDRSRSRQRSSPRGRDRHRSSSRSRDRSKSHLRSRKRKSRSKSKSHHRSRSHSKSHRRSTSWSSTKRSKSRSRSWSQRRSPSAAHSSKTGNKRSKSSKS